jgi:tetratricopeptide (TPR) repeat protein
VQYSPRMVADIRARAAAELANAYRVKENHREALRMFCEAERWREQGTGDLSLAARFYILRGSLWGDQRRFKEALDDLTAARDLYEQLGEQHLAGRATAMMGFYTQYSGDTRRVVATLGK